MKKLMYTLLFMTGFSLAGQAQNSIDRLVEKHSTTGESVFTSAIEREPASQKVIKVVKTLKSNNMNADPFIEAFERIYMLKYDPKSKIGIEVTIIVKPNK